jgi:hypothetical protein
MAHCHNSPEILKVCDCLTEEYIDEFSKCSPNVKHLSIYLFCMALHIHFLLILNEPQTVANLFMPN